MFTREKSTRRVIVAGLAALALVIGTGHPRIGQARPAEATSPTLGTAASFAVLASSTVTNSGDTGVDGNLGVSPGSAVTGFPPGVVTGGTIHAGDAVAAQAQRDTTTAYNNLAGQPCNTTLTGQDLGGLTLTTGVYCFATEAQLTGTLTLNAQGNANAVFIFQIGSTLTTASNSTVQLINGANPCNVFWQVGSSATLGTGTTFVGSILALASITLTTGVRVIGRALARNGAVTMHNNVVSSSGCAPATSPTAIPTAIPTATQIPATATAVAAATSTAVVAATSTAIAAPTVTAVAGATSTAIVAATSTAIAAATSTAVVAPSATAIAAATSAAAATNTAIAAPTMTAVAAVTSTAIIAATSTAIVAATSTAIAAPTSTAIAAASSTAVAAATSTAIAAPTSTAIAAASSTAVAAATSTAIVAAAATRTAVVAPTSTAVARATATAVARATATARAVAHGQKTAVPRPTIMPKPGAGGSYMYTSAYTVKLSHTTENRSTVSAGVKAPITLPRTGGGAGTGNHPSNPIVPLALLCMLVIGAGRFMRSRWKRL